MAESNCAGPAPKRARFGDSSSVEIANALRACVPQATKDATDFWLRVFLDFLKEKDASIDLKTASPRKLNAILCSFYTALRTKKGEYYKRNSYLAARAVVGRYICKTLDRPECNIWRQPQFEQSHRVLDGILKQRKMAGQEQAVQHKPSIVEEDIHRLGSVLRPCAQFD